MRTTLLSYLIKLKVLNTEMTTKEVSGKLYRVVGQEKMYRVKPF
jgi:hypothetical protein